MSHTKGPWTVEKDGFSLTMAGQVVATAISPDYAGIEEQRANARLIAQAPALLEACKRALEDLGNVMLSPGWVIDIDYLLKAIAQAEGKGEER